MNKRISAPVYRYICLDEFTIEKERPTDTLNTVKERLAE